MPITKINLYPYNNYAITQQPQSFEGRLDVIKYATKYKKAKISPHYFHLRAASILDSNKGLYEYTKPTNLHKLDFIYELISKYNLLKHNSKIENPTKSKELIHKIYEKIKYPTTFQLDMAKSSRFTLEEIDKIVDLTTNAKFKEKLVSKLINTNESIDIKKIEDFLNSPLSKQITKKYNEYEPFIKLNLENKNIVSDLEKEISKGYNKQYYLAKSKIVDLIKQSEMFSQISTDELVKHWSEERFVVLKSFLKAYTSINPQNYDAAGITKETIEQIYKSTNKNNAPYRKIVLDYVKKCILFEHKTKEASLDKLTKMFREIDCNEEYRNNLTRIHKQNYKLDRQFIISSLDNLNAQTYINIKTKTTFKDRIEAFKKYLNI